jgi:chromosome segregation ATPase
VSGALISQLRSERKRLEGKIECLRMQHTEAIRDKSAAENKSQNLLDRVTVFEKEKEDLGRWLNEEKEVAAEAKMKAESARTEAQAARKRVAELELKVKSMRAYRKKTESATRAGVDRTHSLFVDPYRDLGAQNAPFDMSGGRCGDPFSWVVAGGARVAPVHRDGPYVLCVAHVL